MAHYSWDSLAILTNHSLAPRGSDKPVTYRTIAGCLGA